MGRKNLTISKKFWILTNRILIKVKTEKTSAEKSINLNTAGIDELITIPGLGEKTAEKILQYRSENGFSETLNSFRK
jgi:competence protein ComEA